MFMKNTPILIISSLIVLACFVLLTQFSPKHEDMTITFAKPFVPKPKKVDPALILANKQKLENSHYTPKEWEFICGFPFPLSCFSCFSWFSQL